MRAAILLAASLVLVGPGMALAGDDATGAVAWRAKADKELLQALDSGAETVKVAIVGPRIAQPEVPFETRAEWKAYWAQESAPFLAAIQQLTTRYGGVVTSTVPAVNTAFVTIGSDRVPDLLGRGDVRRAGLDWLGATYVLGIDGLPGIAANLDATIAKVQAPEMHALGYRGEGVKIAMIDTGIRSTHEMLKNADGTTRVIGWTDHTTSPGGPGYCANPCDVNGHGTHVTTTAVGSNLFNTASQQGVAPRASIIGTRIFQGGGGQWEWAQAGLQAAFDGGAEITSNSWGGGCSGAGITTAELAETLQNAGMINVFASGNSGGGGHICPGMVDNVTSVGAIDINEVVAGFSSRGPCTWPVGSGNSRICPDVMAVGVDVNAGWFNCDTCYQSISGTSMATPHVAGVTVLLQQAHKAIKGIGMNAAGKQSEILLRYSAKDLGPGGIDNDYGWGLAKGKAAYDLLNSGGAINIKHVFSSGKAIIRAYETNRLSLGVVNLGGVGVNGPISLDVRQLDTGQCPPTCESISLSRNIDLPSFTEKEIAYTFDGAVHAAGNYLVEGTFDYGVGMIRETGSFLLKKVDMRATRLATTDLTTGDPILGGWTLVNLGNENATNVRWHDTINVSGFVPLPATPPGTGTYGVFANPAPTRMVAVHFTATKLKYEFDNVGEVKSGGGSWTASANFLAGLPGSYAFEGQLRYKDETGRDFNNAMNAVVPIAPLL